MTRSHPRAPGPSHPTVAYRPSHHPSGPDFHRASSTVASPALRRFNGSRPAPPPPTLRQLAQPDAAPYLASAPERALESPIPLYPDVLDPLRSDPRFDELLMEVNRSWGLPADGRLPSTARGPAEGRGR